MNRPSPISNLCELLIGVKGCGVLDEIVYLLELVCGIFLRRGLHLDSILPGHVLVKDICLKVKTREECVFYCPAKTDVLLHVLPYYEKKTLQFIKSVVKPGDICIDVGAHVGTYTIPIARAIGPMGVVIAIEPSPLCKILEKNVKLNGLENVIISNKAVSSQKKLSHFRYNRWRTGTSSLHEQCTEITSMKVQTEPLDDIVAEAGYSFDNIRLIKIDVEGSELDVIRGAKLTLGKTNYVVLEVRDETITNCINELKSQNFKTCLLEKGKMTNNYVAVKFA